MRAPASSGAAASAAASDTPVNPAAPAATTAAKGWANTQDTADRSHTRSFWLACKTTQWLATGCATAADDGVTVGQHTARTASPGLADDTRPDKNRDSVPVDDSSVWDGVSYNCTWYAEPQDVPTTHCAGAGQCAQVARTPVRKSRL